MPVQVRLTVGIRKNAERSLRVNLLPKEAPQDEDEATYPRLSRGTRVTSRTLEHQRSLRVPSTSTIARIAPDLHN